MKNCFPKQSQVSAAKFLEELRELYDFDLSNYGNTVTQEQLIRDLFIAGIASNEAKCIIFQQDSDTLTTNQCLHLVSSFESVNTCSKSDRPFFSSTEVSSITGTSRQQKGWRCFGCGSSIQHPRRKCPAFEINCHQCGKRGHFAKVCRSRDSIPKSVKAIDSDDATVNSLHINTIKKKSVQGRKTISVLINGKSVPSVLVD